MSAHRIDRYNLLRKLATGGMAEVFLAKTEGVGGFEREVVIKRILPDFSADRAFVEMFIDEARIAAKLHHHNIVQVFDFNKVGNTYYIAMEYIDGPDLRRVLEDASVIGARLEVEECLYIVSEIGKALDYAHKRVVDGKSLNIIHRDVSPHNILLSMDGLVKLTDFGIAKAASRLTRTQDGIVKGKTAYMSPEQARGEHLDARSDLFALGTILFETLTMRRLFFGENEHQILRKVMDARIPSPKMYRKDLSPEVERVVLKLLARRPDKRYQSAAEAVSAIERVYRSIAQEPGNQQLARRLQQMFGTPNHHSPAPPPPVSGGQGGATAHMPADQRPGSARPVGPPPMPNVLVDQGAEYSALPPTTIAPGLAPPTLNPAEQKTQAQLSPTQVPGDKFERQSVVTTDRSNLATLFEEKTRLYDESAHSPPPDPNKTLLATVPPARPVKANRNKMFLVVFVALVVALVSLVLVLVLT
ncbi:MAG: protein kinase [Myxococcales bacterium]|nr:protein kinase [Myxococcales bacterium]